MRGNKIKYAKKRMTVNAIVHSDDYKEGVFETFEYAMTGVKRYHHSLFRLIDLTGCDRIFLDWLTEVMGSDNSVYINEDEIKRFIATVANTGVVYKVSSVQQSFKRLRARNLLLKTKKASGLFHVNPIFFSKSSEKEREHTIRMVMEFDTKEDSESNKIKIEIYKDMKKLKR